MAKLHDMFTQARRAQSGAGMGFLGKNKPDSKAHAAALVIEFPQIVAGNAEAALKAGADGLLFTWNGKENGTLETVKQEIEAAKSYNDDVVSGLRITGGWEHLNRESFAHIKEQGVQYVVLPLTAPAHLLTLEPKDIEKVVTVPMRSEELFPLFIRTLSSLFGITAVDLDFNTNGTLSIEETLRYQAVREAVRYPSFLRVSGELDRERASLLKLLGIQGVILQARADEAATRKELQAVRTLLEQLFEEDKDTGTQPFGRNTK